jgi:hypothetical protein
MNEKIEIISKKGGDVFLSSIKEKCFLGMKLSQRVVCVDVLMCWCVDVLMC